MVEEDWQLSACCQSIFVFLHSTRGLLLYHSSYSAEKMSVVRN